MVKIKGWTKETHHSGKKLRWKNLSPLGNKRTVEIKKESDKYKRYNYAVYWGTNNPKQFRVWKVTKQEALDYAMKYMRSHPNG